jgi:hypothetical protein
VTTVYSSFWVALVFSSLIASICNRQSPKSHRPLRRQPAKLPGEIPERCPIGGLARVFAYFVMAEGSRLIRPAGTLFTLSLLRKEQRTFGKLLGNVETAAAAASKTA